MKRLALTAALLLSACKDGPPPPQPIRPPTVVVADGGEVLRGPPHPEREPFASEFIGVTGARVGALWAAPGGELMALAVDGLSGLRLLRGTDGTWLTLEKARPFRSAAMVGHTAIPFVLAARELSPNGTLAHVVTLTLRDAGPQPPFDPSKALVGLAESGDRLWAVADRGLVLERVPSDGGFVWEKRHEVPPVARKVPDGRGHLVESLPAAPGLRAITFAKESEFFAVGEGGTALHGRLLDKGWFIEAEDTDTRLDLNAVWAGEGEVFAAGATGTVLRRAGNRWVTEPRQTDADLLALAGTSTRDLWVVGERGAAYRFDGESWALRDVGTRAALTTATVDGAGTLFIGTSEGQVLRRLPKPKTP